MARFFISYRREDAAAEAGRLYDLLCKEFGRDAVFMDVDMLQPGSHYRTVIELHLQECRALLAIIGRQWQDIRDESGQRRLESPHDLVRSEIEVALSQGVTVIPVLVDGAAIPAESALPDSVKPLSQLQVIAISTPEFRRDAQKLLDVLSDIDRPGRLSRWVNWRAAAVLLFTVLLSFGLPLAHVASAPAELELRVSQFGFRLAAQQPVVRGLSLDRLGVTGVREVGLPGTQPVAQNALLLEGASAGQISLPPLVLRAGATVWYQRGAVLNEVQLDIDQRAFEFQASVEGPVRIGLPQSSAYTATFAVPARVTFRSESDVVGISARLADSQPTELLRQVPIDWLVFPAVEKASVGADQIVRPVSPIQGGSVVFWPGRGPSHELRAGDWLTVSSLDGQLSTVERAGDVFAVRFVGTVRNLQLGSMQARSRAMPSWLEAAWSGYRLPFLLFLIGYVFIAGLFVTQGRGASR